MHIPCFVPDQSQHYVSKPQNFGIPGPVSRAVTWEKFLRPHPPVSEVLIADDIAAPGDVQACILPDESYERHSTAHDLVKRGTLCLKSGACSR